jgi:hypothetical protein
MAKQVKAKTAEPHWHDLREWLDVVVLGRAETGSRREFRGRHRRRHRDAGPHRR